MPKFETGYDTFEQALKDGFKKIGGPDEIMRIIETGWYQIRQRKEQNMKDQKLRELAKKDPRYKGLMEEAKAQLRKKA